MTVHAILIATEGYNISYRYCSDCSNVSKYSGLINKKHDVFRPDCRQLCLYFLFLLYVHIGVAAPEIWRPPCMCTVCTRLRPPLVEINLRPLHLHVQSPWY